MARESSVLTFDEQIYSIDAMQKAAYRFIHLYAVDFAHKDSKIECIFTPTQEISAEGNEHYLNEFKKEVLDQHLRIKIKNETEEVRNLILGIAFSNSGLLADE